MQQESSIAERNRDVEHIVNAAAKYGAYGLGKMFPKRFALLVIADVHRCRRQVERATEYLDTMPALDVGICLGDMQGCDFAENDGTWYTDVIRETEKPFYTVIGNHDGGNSHESAISGSKSQVFQKFILSTRDNMKLPTLDKTYYSVVFDEYKICLIVLDNYDVPDELDESKNFVISRGVEMIGQEQANWLVHTLSEVPQEYHVIIARHSATEKCNPIECNWTQMEHKMEASDKGVITADLVADVMDAWIYGKTIKGEYSSDDFKLAKPVKVEADFSNRGTGNFVGYLIGHTHFDWLGVCEKYPNQHVVNVASSANDKWQNVCSDLPRLEGTKAEDCLTVLTVDTENNTVYLVRVGSNVTYELKERTFYSFKY